MHGPEFLIPIFMFLVIGVIWGGIIVTRHRERMTIIEKGMNPEDLKTMYERSTRAANPLVSLKWGILFFCVGVAILLGIWLREAYFVNDGVIPGLMVLLGGVGLVLFYFIANKKAA